MSDLDLDAIRAWWSNFDASVDAGLRDLHPSLAVMAVSDIRALLAEVERLRANQLPDGGVWRTQYSYHGELWWDERTDPRMGLQRVVGPAEPIPSESDSAAPNTPAESTSDQTAPKTA